MKKDKLNKLFMKIASLENESGIIELDKEVEKYSKTEDLLEAIVLKNLLITKSHEFAILNVAESLSTLLNSEQFDFEIPNESELH